METIEIGTQFNMSGYKIGDKEYNAFVDIFKDTSPIHINDSFAIEAGFSQKVMHGNILNCFLSHFIGVVYPGKSGFLVAEEIRYQHPNFLHDEIEIKAKITHFSESINVVELSIQFWNITQEKVVARAKVQVKMLQGTK